MRDPALAMSSPIFNDHPRNRHRYQRHQDYRNSSHSMALERDDLGHHRRRYSVVHRRA
jgi:hypothetical protein